MPRKTKKQIQQIVGDIIRGKKKIGIRTQYISKLNLHGFGQALGVEYLSYFSDPNDAKSYITGGQLFDAAHHLKKVADLDVIAIDAICDCILNSRDTKGNSIPRVEYHHINLSRDIFTQTTTVFDAIRKIIKTCKRRKVDPIFELSEKMDDDTDFDNVAKAVDRFKSMKLALDDTFSQKGVFLRNPVVYETEFMDNIRFTKIDCGFLWKFTDIARFPNTLSKLIMRDNCGGGSGYCLNNGSLIIEGVENERNKDELFDLLTRTGNPDLIVQGDMVPYYEADIV